MQLDETTYNELLDYLARRPWFEVNKLIVKLAQRPQLTAPSAVQEATHGNNES